MKRLIMLSPIYAQGIRSCINGFVTCILAASVYAADVPTPQNDPDEDVDAQSLKDTEKGDGITPLKPTYINSWEESANGEHIYSRAPAGSVSIPPELKDFWKKTDTTSRGFRWIVNAVEFGLNPKDWQSDTSRIIYHGGKYHVCGNGVLVASASSELVSSAA